MIVQILINTPVWVWGLLCALLALGWAQSRTRHVAPAQLLALPAALLLLGLWSMAPGFAAQPMAVGCWLLALAAGTWLGGRLPRPVAALWLPTKKRLQLPGSWMPMVIIVTIFLLRYVTGVAQAMHPGWRTQLAVQAPLALAFGALSGVFLGRALGLHALTRARVPAPHAAA